MLDQPTDEPVSPELAEQSTTYQKQAIRALDELRVTPGARHLLAYALLTKLAQDNAVVEDVYDATQGLCQQPVSNPRPPAHEELIPSPGAVDETIVSSGERREGPGLVSPVPLPQQKNTPGRVLRQNASKRRTFRDIVEHHPRGNGKSGFTVGFFFQKDTVDELVLG